MTSTTATTRTHQGSPDRPTDACENCSTPDTATSPLVSYFVDQDPTNPAPENLIRLCPTCYKHWLVANPDGISDRYGQWAFAINRGLYQKTTTRRKSPCKR